MGYNNNHAGVHLIQRSGYGGYTGMAYDQAVQDEYFFKAISEKRAQLAEKRRKRQDELATMQKPATIEQPSTENPATPVTEKPAVTTSTVEQTTNKKEQPKKNMSKNNNRDIWAAREEVINKELHELSVLLIYGGRTPGTEEVVDIHHFIGRDFITKNIIIHALREKIEPVGLLIEAEILMQKDKRTNPSLVSDPRYNPRMPKLEWSIVFLSIVAEMLGCSLQELIIFDEAYCKKFAYELLDSIMANISYFEGEVDERGNAVIEVYPDRNHWLSSYVGVDQRLGGYRCTPVITVEKDVYDDGDVGYALSYGDLTVPKDIFLDYSLKGAYLLEEEKGKLQEFVDKLIIDHPEWKEPWPYNNSTGE